MRAFSVSKVVITSYTMMTFVIILMDFVVCGQSSYRRRTSSVGHSQSTNVKNSKRGGGVGETVRGELRIAYTHPKCEWNLKVAFQSLF